MHTLDQPDDVDDVTDRLSDRYHDDIPRDVLRVRVDRHFHALQSVAVRDYVPLLVERRVRAELRVAS